MNVIKSTRKYQNLAFIFTSAAILFFIASGNASSHKALPQKIPAESQNKLPATTYIKKMGKVTLKLKFRAESIRRTSKTELSGLAGVSKNSVLSVPAGEKLLMALELTDSRNGKSLRGWQASAELQSASAQQSNDHDHETLDQKETYIFHADSSDVGVLESARFPGARLGKALGANYAGAVKLKGKPADALADHDSNVFISNPSEDNVSVINIISRKKTGVIRTGKRPYHVALQPVTGLIWVGNDGDGTVTSINPVNRRTKTYRAGRGHHDFAFSSDGRLIFVSSSKSGKVSFIDLNKGTVHQRTSGRGTHGLAYEPVTQRLFAANADAGNVTVFAVASHKLKKVGEFSAGKGSTQIGIEPLGRLGVVSNKVENTATVFDIRTRQSVKTIPTGIGPDGIVFIDRFALIRNTGSPNATFIDLSDPGLANEIQLGADNMANQIESADSPEPTHGRLILSPDGKQVTAIDPSGKLIHLHVMNHEPMVMGQQNVNPGVSFVLPIDNKTREVSPGKFRHVFQIKEEGDYKLTLRFGGRIENVELPLKAASSKSSGDFEIIPPQAGYRFSGEPFNLEYRILHNNRPLTDLTDGRTTVYRFSGGRFWQKILDAEHTRKGIFRSRVKVPSPGVYSIKFTAQSIGLRSEHNPPAKITVE